MLPSNIVIHLSESATTTTTAILCILQYNLIKCQVLTGKFTVTFLIGKSTKSIITVLSALKHIICQKPVKLIYPSIQLITHTKAQNFVV